MRGALARPLHGRYRAALQLQAAVNRSRAHAQWCRSRACQTLQRTVRKAVASRAWVRVRRHRAAVRLQSSARCSLRQREWGRLLSTRLMQAVLRRALHAPEWARSRASLTLECSARRALQQRRWLQVGILSAAPRRQLAQAQLAAEVAALRRDEERASEALACARSLRGAGTFRELFGSLQPLITHLSSHSSSSIRATLEELDAFEGKLCQAREREEVLAELQENIRGMIAPRNSDSCSREQLEDPIKRRDAVYIPVPSLFQARRGSNSGAFAQAREAAIADLQQIIGDWGAAEERLGKELNRMDAELRDDGSVALLPPPQVLSAPVGLGLLARLQVVCPHFASDKLLSRADGRS